MEQAEDDVARADPPGAGGDPRAGAVPLLLKISRAVGETDDYQGARRLVLELLCGHLGWRYGEVWLPDHARGVLRCSPEWYGAGPAVAAFRDLSAAFTFGPDVGLPGRCWARRGPEWMADVAAAPPEAFLRSAPALAAGLHAALAVPALAGDELLAIFVFFAGEAGPEDPALVELSILAIDQLGGAFRRLQASEALREREEQLRRLNAELEQRVDERTQALRGANAQLEQALRLKDEFLATMSHELRTPLNTILSMAESCAEGIYGPLNDRQLHSLAVIAESGQRLLTLVNDILDVAKIEAGHLQLSLEPVPVDDLCASCLAAVRELVVAKRLQTSTAGIGQVDELQADPRRLRQVLVNLLSNAVKFTPAGGSIGLEVRGDPAAGVAHLTVWDTGIGIAPEDLGRLFQPFVQLDGGLSRSHEGSGLGLILVSRLTDLHGGSVSVESAPGQGSRFTVTLPWRQPAGAAARAAPAGPPQAARAAPTVVLADDNALVLESTGAYLAARGYRVIMARNGAEAVETVRSIQPALVVMDVQMPVMDGLEAIRRIRADGAFAATPLIALTALAMPGDRQRCLAAGATEYLAKPVNLGLLAELIASELARAALPPPPA